MSGKMKSLPDNVTPVSSVQSGCLLESYVR